MQNVNIQVFGSRLEIDFEHAGLKTETLADRAKDLLPLLYALLAADDTWLKLPSEDARSRELGYLAMNMVCQAVTLDATRKAILLKEIADGSQSISDHGFPEFDGGQSIAV